MTEEEAATPAPESAPAPESTPAPESAPAPDPAPSLAPTPSLESTPTGEAPSLRRRSKKVVEAEGVAHIQATFNNTLITITDNAGNTVVWGSAGKAGFKGSKKSTPFAATVAAKPSPCRQRRTLIGIVLTWPVASPLFRVRIVLGQLNELHVACVLFILTVHDVAAVQPRQNSPKR